MNKHTPLQNSSMTANADSKKVAVIGAGAAGLCAAKYLLQTGFTDVTIFEMGSNVGGLWCYMNDNGRSAAYRTLHINTAKHLTNYTGFPFDADVQMFPDHEDMHRYFNKFVDAFDLRRRIKFNANVVSARPASGSTPEAPSWDIETADGAVERFDRVIAATGHLSVPLHVEQFRTEFKGQYLHSHDYKEPEPFVGKKICVVGIGNSAVDIASDVCVNAKKTVLVARSGVLIQPKMIFGIPFTDLTLKLYRWWIPAFVRKALLGFLVYIMHGDLTKFGFRPVTKKVHTTSNPVVITHVAYNRISVKHEIERIEGRRIHFNDGSSDEFDVLVGATGYLIDLPFLSDEILPVKANSISLYKRIVTPDWPGLYFAGFVNPTTALNLTFEYQARWIAAIEKGWIKLPGKAAMVEAIEKKKNWISRMYKNTPRHTIEEEHVGYFRELKIPNSEKRFGSNLPV